jgi:hypothetical protein
MPHSAGFDTKKRELEKRTSETQSLSCAKEATTDPGDLFLELSCLASPQSQKQKTAPPKEGGTGHPAPGVQTRGANLGGATSYRSQIKIMTTIVASP